MENAGGGATWAAPIATLIIEKYLILKLKSLEEREDNLCCPVSRLSLEEKMINKNLIDK